MCLKAPPRARTGTTHLEKHAVRDANIPPFKPMNSTDSLSIHGVLGTKQVPNWKRLHFVTKQTPRTQLPRYTVRLKGIYAFQKILPMAQN